MTTDTRPVRRRPFGRWRDGYRQLRQHRAFRIAEPEWDDASQRRLRDLTDRLLAALPTTVPDGDAQTGSGTPSAEASNAAPGMSDSALAQAATNLWRARKKLTADGDDVSRVQRQVARYLRTSQQALDSAGVVVTDHDGERWDPRLALELIAWEDDPSRDRPTVIETVRPTIHLAERRIQMGQVIVAGPPEADENPVEDNRA